MELHCLSLPPLGANCYLLKLRDRLDGLVIDPGGAPEAVVHACGELNMTPAAILLTHSHFDHVGALNGLLEVWPGLPVYAHSGTFPAPLPPPSCSPSILPPFPPGRSFTITKRYLLPEFNFKCSTRTGTLRARWSSSVRTACSLGTPSFAAPWAAPTSLAET